MDEQKILAQIMRDMQQHASAESVLRDNLNARIRDLEREVSTWGDESLKDDCKIRNLKYKAGEYRRALNQIAQSQQDDGTFKLTIAECVKLAIEALTHGDSYAEEAESTKTHRAE